SPDAVGDAVVDLLQRVAGPVDEGDLDAAGGGQRLAAGQHQQADEAPAATERAHDYSLNGRKQEASPYFRPTSSRRATTPLIFSSPPADSAGTPVGDTRGGDRRLLHHLLGDAGLGSVFHGHRKGNGLERPLAQYVQGDRIHRFPPGKSSTYCPVSRVRPGQPSTATGSLSRGSRCA